MDTLKSYLESSILAWKDSAIAAYNKLILDHGERFCGVVPSDSIEETRKWRKARKPKIKQCFYNSQMFILTADNGLYYEGYCFDGLIPFHHAWVVIDGKVVDFTLESRDKSLKRQKIKNTASNPVYLGVVVPKRFIMTNIVKTGVAEPLAHKHYLKSELRFL
jgi:hypothetical protein